MTISNNTQNMISADDKRVVMLTNICYWFCITGMLAASVFLFYRQAIQFDGGYPSDLSYYVRVTTEEGGARLLSKIFFTIFSTTSSVKCIAFYLGLVIVGIAIASKYLVEELLQAETNRIPYYYSRIASLMMLFAGSIYVPHFHPYFYRRSWNCFVWHSPTQQTMILFSLIALIFFARISHTYIEKIRVGDWLGLAVFAALSTWTKPSFFMVFAPAIISAFLVELFAKKWDNRLDEFKKLFVFGCSLFPAGFVMLYFTFWYSGENEGSSILFGLANFFKNNDNLVAKIACGLSIPIIVALFNIKRLKELSYSIAAWMLGYGILEWMLIYETGEHAKHGNFDWGKQFACFYIILCAYALFIGNINDKNFLKEKNWLRVLYVVGVLGLIALVVLTRGYYFCELLQGRKYMI